MTTLSDSVAARSPIITKRYYTPSEFAALCRFSRALVYQKMRSGEIVTVKPFGSRKLIPCAWAEEYLANIEQEAVASAAAEAEARRLEPRRRRHVVRRSGKKAA